MATELVPVVAIVVTSLAPFMPFLIEVGKAGGKKLVEVIAEKGGTAAWEKAQALWSKLKQHFGKDTEVMSAATMVAANPADKVRQIMLAELLAARLKGDPKLLQEFLALLGGKEVVQQVTAERDSWVENITQRLRGGGKQIIEANDKSVIKGVRQVKE